MSSIGADVTIIAASELGVGVSTLLDQKNIMKIKVKTGIPVKEAVEAMLKELAQTS